MKDNLLISLHSDFHFERFTSNQRFPTLVKKGMRDVLILAGDICVAEDVKQFPFSIMGPAVFEPERYKVSLRYKNFFQRVTQEFPMVLVVMGNHEYYHGSIDLSKNVLEQNLNLISNNIKLLDNDTIIHQGVRFIGTTLWTNLNNQDPVTMWNIQGCMNDYRCISTPTGKLTSEDIVQMHTRSVEYIRDVCTQDQDTPVVVIGHHAPSMLSIHPRYANDRIMNGGYASDLSAVMLDHSNIKAWVHGHVHTPFNYKIGNCEVRCNPRGYLGFETEDIMFAPMFFDV